MLGCAPSICDGISDWLSDGWAECDAHGTELGPHDGNALEESLDTALLWTLDHAPLKYEGYSEGKSEWPGWALGTVDDEVFLRVAGYFARTKLGHSLSQQEAFSEGSSDGRTEDDARRRALGSVDKGSTGQVTGQHAGVRMPRASPIGKVALPRLSLLVQAETVATSICTTPHRCQPLEPHLRCDTHPPPYPHYSLRTSSSTSKYLPGIFFPWRSGIGHPECRTIQPNPTGNSRASRTSPQFVVHLHISCAVGRSLVTRAAGVPTHPLMVAECYRHGVGCPCHWLRHSRRQNAIWAMFGLLSSWAMHQCRSEHSYFSVCFLIYTSTIRPCLRMYVREASVFTSPACQYFRFHGQRTFTICKGRRRINHEGHSKFLGKCAPHYSSNLQRGVDCSQPFPSWMQWRIAPAAAQQDSLLGEDSNVLTPRSLMKRYLSVSFWPVDKKS